MWTFNRGEAFHPHCVDLDQRHKLFQVVKEPTSCKNDCAVKSVSAFIAPRGSSSDKYFTVLITIMAISGFFGSVRWHLVGDASLTEGVLASVGFLSLILVSIFELDVSSNSFIEEKLAVTASFLYILRAQDKLNVQWTQYSTELLNFVRESPDIKHMYAEAQEVEAVYPTLLTIPFILHILGAGNFVLFVTAAVVSNDYTESHMGVFVIFGLNIFLLLTYFCGTYLPISWVFPSWQGQLFSWNPFVRDQDFLIKLQKAVNWYSKNCLEKRNCKSESTCRRRSTGQATDCISSESSILFPEDDMKTIADTVLKKYRGAQLAKNRPKFYLRLVSYIMVLTELATLLVPMVAMGAQWITALCSDTPTVSAIIHLTYWSLRCLVQGEADMCLRMTQSCIVASK